MKDNQLIFWASCVLIGLILGLVIVHYRTGPDKKTHIYESEVPPKPIIYPCNDSKCA